MAAGKDDSTSSAAATGGNENPNLFRNPFLPHPNHHPFWETQPVLQFADAGDPSFPEGPIVPQIPSSDLSQNPYNLPAQFEWKAIDIDDDSAFSDLHQFISKNYAGNVAPLPFPYSPAFLRWLLRDPNRIKSLHVAVCAKNSKKLVGFIAATPATVRIRAEILRVAIANILCVHKKLRSKRLAPVLIRELARRAQLEGIWQGVYATEMHLPTPFLNNEAQHLIWLTPLIRSPRLLYRILNPEKIRRCGHTVQIIPQVGVGIQRLNKWFKVAKTAATRGFRKMDSGDVVAVSEMLKLYHKKFEVALEVDEHFVHHSLLPQPGLVDSYVVEDPETNEITDFCSFLIHDAAVENDPKYSELRCAVLFYYATFETGHSKLMRDVLVMAKDGGADLFLAYDLMGNYSFLDRLLFRAKAEDEGKMINYYFYNYRVRGELQPWEIGLLL